MAKYGKSLAQVVVEINGQKQVNNILNAMKSEADKLRESLKAAEKELAVLASGGDEAAHKAKLKEMNEMKEGLKQLERSIKETEKVNLNLDDILANTSKYSATVLNNTRKKIEATLRAMKPVTEEQRQQMRQMQQDVRDLSDEINRRMGKITAFEDIMSSISRVDDRTLDGVIKRLKELIATTDSLDGEKIMKYKEQLAFAEETKRQRTLSEGRKLIGKVEKGVYQDAIEGTQQSIKLLEEYKKVLKTTDAKGIEQVNNVIEQLKINIKETESGFLSFDDAMTRAQGVMDGSFKPTLEDLEKIQKTIKEGMQNKFRVSDPEDEKQLKETLRLMEEMAKKQQEVMRLNHQSKVDAVSGKLDKVSTAEIEEAVKAAKELQQVAKTKEEFIELGTFIGKATDRLKDWNETSKQATMKNQIKDLSAIRSLSDAALQEQTKFWEGAMNGAKKTTNAYKDAKKNFEALQQESKRRLQFEGEQTINKVKLGEGDGSTKQMQERLKVLQDYRAIIDGTKPDAYKSVDEAILKLTEDIKASQAGFLSFDEALKRAKGVSDGSFKPTLENLEQIQKVLKEGMHTKFQLSNPEDEKRMKETLRLMDEMTKKQQEVEQLRLKEQAQGVMAGNFTKTIEGTKQAIELLKKYQGTLDATKPEAIEDVNKKIREMNELLETASKKKAADVMANPMAFSVDELNEAIKLTEKLQSATNNTSVWKQYEEQLVKAKEARDRFADDSKFNTMLKQFGDLEKLSANAYAEQKKYWEGMRDSGKHYDEAVKKLSEMAELEQQRMKEMADDIMANNYEKTIEGTKQAIELLKKYQATLDSTEYDAINDITDSIKKMNIEMEAASRKYAKEILATPTAYSPAEIDEAIKMAEKMQSEVTGPEAKKEWNDLALQIDKARKVRDEFVSGGKFEIMNKQFADFDNLSKSAAQEQKKYWEGLADSMAKTDPRYQTVLDNIDKIKEAEKAQLESKATDIMSGTYDKTIEGTKQAIEILKKYQGTLDATNTDAIEDVNKAIREMNAELDAAAKKKATETLTTNINTAGTEDIKQSVEWLKKYQGTLEPLGPEWNTINKEIKEGEKRLKELTDRIKMDDMSAQFGKLKDLSVNALAEQKKYWTEVKNTYSETTEQYKSAVDNLKDIKKLENERTEASANAYITEAKGGKWDKTIEETQQAIKLIEEYKKQLKTKTDEPAIEEANKAIEILNGNLGKTKESLMAYNEALKIVQDAGAGNFDGTAEELEKAKKSLEAFRKTLKMNTDAKEIKKIDEALQGISNSAIESAKKVVNLDTVLGRLDTASMEDLQQAAKQLQEKLEGASRKTEDYVRYSAKLREVNLELKRAKKEWEGQENVITRTAKRLAAYVAVYGGWNEIWGRTKEIYKENLTLSDSLADIQKTTGLSAESVGRLSNEINAIDTRTAQKELHDLAYEAGKLGISAEEDVMAFVKAGNQLLVALGEDLGGAEAVRSLMKVNAILGETEKLGVEKALLSTGSAINEISQTSRASAGPIADMVSRMGAIGAAAGLSMSDLIALAGTADALGQSSEVAATAFNKFISTLKSNPVDVAFALGMDSDEIQKQLDAGNTMRVIQDIFEKMSTMGDMESLAPIMGDLGSEGARMTQVLVTMAKGVGELNAQVFTSRNAFEQATSVTNEYNIKNESAAAILQRMSNSARELVVNSGLVKWLEDVLRWLADLPNMLERNVFWLKTFRLVWYELLVLLSVRTLRATWGALKDLFGSLSVSLKVVYADAARAAAGLKALEGAAKIAALRKIALAGALGRVTLAFKVLWGVISANPLGVIATAVTGIVVLFQNMTRETREAARAKAELVESISREHSELDILRRKIENANGATGERQALINQLNNKYGQYLGFMVTEQNYLEQQDYIYGLLNAKIRENISLKMKEKMTEDVAGKYAQPRKDAYAGVLGELGKVTGMNEASAVTQMTDVMTAVRAAAEAGAKDVNSVLMEIGGADFKQKMEQLEADLKAEKISGGEYSAQLTQLKYDTFGDRAAQLEVAIKRMVEVEANIHNETKNVEDLVNSVQESDRKSAEELTKKHIEKSTETILNEGVGLDALKTYEAQTAKYVNKLVSELGELEAVKKNSKSLTYAELEFIRDYEKEVASGLNPVEEARIKRYDELIKRQKEGREYTDEEKARIEELNKDLGKVSDTLAKVSQKIGEAEGVSLWGTIEEKQLAMNSPQQLVNMWDKLEADAKRLSEASFKNIGEWVNKGGKQMATQFWRRFETRDAAVNWYKQQKDAIAAQLKKLGYSTSGNFLTGSGDGDQKSKARQYYKSAMDALEAYYKEYEDFIRQQRADNQMTEEDMNRQIMDNDRKFHEDRQQLIKKFLGEESTFDKSVYKGALSWYEYFADKNLDEWAAYYQANGDALEDGARKQIADSGLKISKALNKEQEKIKKELLKGDVFATFEDNFASMLDELGALTSKLEDDANRVFNDVNRKAGIDKVFGLSDEERAQRIAVLTKFADKSYQLKADGLKKEMLLETNNALWVQRMNDEEMQLLLEKLRTYYDDRLGITKKYQNELVKEFESYYQQSEKLADLEARKQKQTDKTKKQEMLEGIGVRPSYGAKRKGITDTAAIEGEQLAESIDFYEEHLKTMKEGSQEYLATQALIKDKKVELNEILAQSERDLTQVYMDEWTKRAEKWGQVGEIFGDFLGEQVMLEKQANDARARGDEETAKKIEQQQKENRHNLIQGLLNFIVDEAALWAKELGLKMMFNAMSIADDKKKAIEEATTQGKSSMLSIFLSALTGQASEAKKGLPGLITGAVVFAATMALQAMAKSAISNMFPEAEVGSTGSRKLSTGMLTYADGNYPVLGNDGKVYDAKYEGAGMKTGVYGGGAHFGIFSEKQPEMIVDGKTTQKIILNYPYIYDAITTIAKNGRLKNAMPTFAAGDYPAGMKQLSKAVAVDGGASSNDDMIQMRATMEESKEVNRQLLKLLQGGITAHLDGLETHRQQKKNERFLKRRGID